MHWLREEKSVRTCKTVFSAVVLQRQGKKLLSKIPNIFQLLLQFVRYFREFLPPFPLSVEFNPEVLNKFNAASMSRSMGLHVVLKCFPTKLVLRGLFI